MYDNMGSNVTAAEDTTVELPFSAMNIPQQVINLSLTAFDTTLLQSNNACAVPHVTSVPLPWHWYTAVSTSLIIMIFIEQTHFVRTQSWCGQGSAVCP